MHYVQVTDIIIKLEVDTAIRCRLMTLVLPTNCVTLLYWLFFIWTKYMSYNLSHVTWSML